MNNDYNGFQFIPITDARFIVGKSKQPIKLHVHFETFFCNMQHISNSKGNNWVFWHKRFSLAFGLSYPHNIGDLHNYTIERWYKPDRRHSFSEHLMKFSLAISLLSITTPIRSKENVN